MKSTLYLTRLFYANKFLFVIAVLFMGLSLAANLVFRAEHTPLFLWGLYSQRIAPQTSYSFLEVRYNDNQLLLFPHTADEPRKLMFTNTLDYYVAMKRNQDIDPLSMYIDNWNSNHPFFKKLVPGLKFYNDTAELKKFPAWYKKYLEQHIEKKVYRVDVFEVKVAYLENGKLKRLSSTLILKLL